MMYLHPLILILVQLSIPLGSSAATQSGALYETLSDTLSADAFYTETGNALFTSSVPLHEFTGESDHLTGMIDLSSGVVDFYLDLNTLKTGNSRRDRDMYQTLKSDDFPFAEFTGQLLDSVDVESRAPQTVRVRGEMSLHGISRDLVVEGTLQLNEDQLHLQAEWVLDITDYDIEPPGILFYRVRDEMDVRIEAVLNREDPSAESSSEASARFSAEPSITHAVEPLEPLVESLVEPGSVTNQRSKSSGEQTE